MCVAYVRVGPWSCKRKEMVFWSTTSARPLQVLGTSSICATWTDMCWRWCGLQADIERCSVEGCLMQAVT
eukprot:4050383-Amphidinium_carterae.1